MKKRGFTLIELLVVISIIGLLSSIVLASIRTAREKAEITALKSNFLSVRNALELYRSDYGDYPESTGESYLPPPGSGSINNLFNSLTPYLKSPPTIPNYMIDGDGINHVIYIKNPLNGVYYTCNDSAIRPTNGYVVVVTTMGATISLPSDMGKYFPSMYEYEDFINSYPGYCLVNPPK